MLMLPKDKEAEVMRIKNNSYRFQKVLKICDAIKHCNPDVGGCGRRQPKFTKTGLRIQMESSDEMID